MSTNSIDPNKQNPRSRSKSYSKINTEGSQQVKHIIQAQTVLTKKQTSEKKIETQMIQKRVIYKNEQIARRNVIPKPPNPIKEAKFAHVQRGTAQYNQIVKKFIEQMIKNEKNRQKSMEKLSLDNKQKSNSKKYIQQKSEGASFDQKLDSRLYIFKMKLVINNSSNVLNKQLKPDVYVILTNQYLYIGNTDQNGNKQGSGFIQYILGNNKGDMYFGTWVNNNFLSGTYYNKSKGFFYTANWQNSKILGNVKINYQNRDTYDGQVISASSDSVIRQGKGLHKFQEQKQQYNGQWANDKFNGKGQYIYQSKIKYIGNWRNGLRNDDKGQIYYMDINEKIIAKFEGQFKDNQITGNGILNCNGYIYKGQWLNGIKHGKGNLTLKNNDTYEGQFKDDTFNGNGIYTFAASNTRDSKRYYKGNFLNGYPHGKGKYSIGQAYYEGDWKNGKKAGKGKMVFSQIQQKGSFLDGQWFDKALSEGKYKWGNGDLYQGTFQNGKLDCNGTYTWSSDKSKLVCRWQNNKPNGDVTYQYRDNNNVDQKFKFSMNNGQITSKSIISAQ